MKKILALGLAAAMAAATVGVTAETASAKDWNWQKHGNWNGNGNWRRHNNWHGGNNFFVPFLLGGALGYGLGQSYGPYYDYGPSYAYGYGNPHVQWCASHYRTYNPATNTFFVRPGVPQVCISPYGG